MSPHTVARLCLLGTAFLFSTGGAAVKLTDIPAGQVASLRSAIAAIFLFAVLPASRRDWSWRSAAVAVPYAATLVLFVIGNKLTTAANTIFLQYTAPLYVLPLAICLLGERPRRRDLFFVGFFAAGLLMLFLGRQPPLLTAPDPLRGNLAAGLSGLTWALTVLGLRWLATAEPAHGRTAAPAVVCGNALAFLVTFPWAASGPYPSASNWVVLLYLGAFQIGVAYVLMLRAVAHLTALETSLLLLLEPVLSTLWAWLLHAETPVPWSLVGGAVILVAAAAKTWIEGRPQLYRASTPRDSP